ncbi:cytoplasmic dynein 1 light intermediate chain 2-like isoform X4 [Strigops habroptila]|uniref:cytoplasmic dynein 1 light intermediate chain 2-like isoform X4 n=1 Tax=Strigops habroptila TaxID=2489341 RepID=UPI0011CFB21B|nr:cytoplasmic dynein 1 light intermediate chain 2-like isoform X4 [Strigops habroptila]
MALVLVEKKLLGLDGFGGAELPSEEEEEGQNLWSSILSEVSTRSRSKLPSGKNILVFDHTRCNVWILDGDLYHKGLLKFAVSAESLQDTIVVFVADMSRPWTVMESLQKWASVLQEHIDKMKIPPEEMRDMEQKFIKEFQEYVEPEEGYQGSPQRRGPSGQEDEHVSLPLGENVLTHNLGIPVLVVCTKCDAVSVLEKEHDYREEHFDFIQSHIRKFCLQYGAALIYTSVKEEKNIDLLYKYIVHKTYGFQFTTPALVVEKDAVFIPAGWDNENKIAILHENFMTVKPEDAYEDFIVKPLIRKLVHDKELAAEDEQVFLMKQQSFLAKQPATPTRPSESPARGPAGSPRTQGRAGSVNVPSASPITSVKKPDPNIKNNAASEGVLASFFNSLLSKKTGSPGSPGAGGVQSIAKKSGQKPGLTNVQEELDRMTRRPDSMVTTNSPPTENEA